MRFFSDSEFSISHREYWRDVRWAGYLGIAIGMAISSSIWIACGALE